MASSVLSDILASILAVFMLMIGPIYNTYKTTDFTSDAIARNAVSYFQKEVRKDGYIDIKSYNNFLTELCKSGRVYKVTLTHTSRLVYPKGNRDFQICKIDYSTRQILNKINTGKYVMKYGDDFSISVTETEVAPSRLLVGILSNSSKFSLLTFSGGGMVENEVFD